MLVATPNFMILPDMKWDLKTLASLYLVALVRDRNIRSLRDLRKQHVGILKSIRKEAERVVLEKWGLEKGSLRMYIHYQPSYCKVLFFFLEYGARLFEIRTDHFHVHIVNANQTGFMGTTVGQAHLLDDIISLVNLHLNGFL